MMRPAASAVEAFMRPSPCSECGGDLWRQAGASEVEVEGVPASTLGVWVCLVCGCTAYVLVGPLDLDQR